MLKNIFRSSVLRLFSYNAVSVVVKFIAGFLSLKIYSNILGTKGFALIGNFRNFTDSVRIISTIGFDTGIVKLIAENKESKNVSNVFSNAFYIRSIGSAVLSVIIIVLAHQLNYYLVGNMDVKLGIYLLAVFLPFFSINNLLIAVLNGLEFYKRIITINIISTILGFLFMFYLVLKFQFKGVIVSLAVVESLIIIVTILFLKKHEIKLQRIKISREISVNLLKFSMMTLVSAIVIPLSLIYIRNTLIKEVGLHQAGIWDAMNRISSYYMMIFSSGISLYYLPKIASVNSIVEKNKEIKMYFKIFLPLALCLFVLLYFTRNYWIVFLLNKQFSEISSVLLYQLLIDFVKISSLCFGYILLAKAKVKMYVFIELLYYCLYIIFTLLLLKLNFGFISVYLSLLFASVVVLMLLAGFYVRSIYKEEI